MMRAKPDFLHSSRWSLFTPMRHSIVATMALGSGLALLMSTEFLFQPFIWRNYGLDEIMVAWVAIFRDKLIVAACVAVALTTISSRGNARPGWRLVLQLLAVLCGALAGELLISRIDPQADAADTLQLIGRVSRWALAGGTIAILIQLWRSGTRFAVAGEEARLEAVRLRRLAASSQMEILKRQIEPHFLFNTLATIRRLQVTDPARSQALLGRLFDFMSATLAGGGSSRSTLGSEIALVRAYLDVCAARMSGKLRILCNIPLELEISEFPPLVLATLAENAIKHGIFPQNGGEIAIDAMRRANGVLEVAITDDGIGFGMKSGGNGIGLANICERLQLLYGSRASLRLESNIPRGVRAILSIPLSAA